MRLRLVERRDPILSFAVTGEVTRVVGASARRVGRVVLLVSRMDVVLCSDCFRDEGLRLDAEAIGVADADLCPLCRSSTGKKLDRDRLTSLAYSFFVWGTMHRARYGAAPVVQFNEHRPTDIAAPD